MWHKILTVITILNSLLILSLFLGPRGSEKTTIPLFLKPSAELQKSYLDGLIYCDEKNFAHRGPYIACMNAYIERNAPQEVKAYKRIKQYCRIKDDNECDIDNCTADTILWL